MFIKSFLVAGLLAGGIASPAILLADDNTPDFPVPVQRARNRAGGDHPAWHGSDRSLP